MFYYSGNYILYYTLSPPTPPPGVCQSIQQPVTKDWLLTVIAEHRWRPEPNHFQGEVRAGGKRPHDGTPSELMPPPKMPPRRT